MGQKIAFYSSTTRKSLKELIAEHYPDSRTWLLQKDEESQQEYNQKLISISLRYFLQKHEHIVRIEEVGQSLLDDFTSSFFGLYCDHGNGSGLYKLRGPLVGKRRYYISTELVTQHCDQEAISIWHYLVDGRSLKGKPFIAQDDKYKIGYWTVEEQRHLRKSLQMSFGTIKHLQHQYWTTAEKRNYQQAAANSKNGIILLSDFNPVSEGIECVLQLLAELKEEKTVIVFGIE